MLSTWPCKFGNSPDPMQCIMSLQRRFVIGAAAELFGFGGLEACHWTVLYKNELTFVSWRLCMFLLEGKGRIKDYEDALPAVALL